LGVGEHLQFSARLLEGRKGQECFENGAYRALFGEWNDVGFDSAKVCVLSVETSVELKFRAQH
jgi:hypothetical protein